MCLNYCKFIKLYCLISVIFVLNFLKLIYIMHLIKLSAISSTNDFLKQLSASGQLEDFTVVWAEQQTEGKGQMGGRWVSESSKNLTFSILLNGTLLKIEDLFTLNVMVANAVIKALNFFEFDHISVKWPNDILSYNKKIAGILIENNIRADGTIHSVVGIGINVMQTLFDGFPQASSIFLQYGEVVEQEQLLSKIVSLLKSSVLDLRGGAKEEWDFYHEHLFRKDVASVFETTLGQRFMGIIKNVNHHGQLVVEPEHGDLKYFNLKEIKLLY